MRKGVVALFAFVLASLQINGLDNKWYSGDVRCPPPDNDGRYSAPYNALDHRQDYPIFSGADKPGWSCSYNREDGVLIQYGDSRTPQQQWLFTWGGSNDN